LAGGEGALQSGVVERVQAYLDAVQVLVQVVHEGLPRGLDERLRARRIDAEIELRPGVQSRAAEAQADQQDDGAEESSYQHGMATESVARCASRLDARARQRRAGESSGWRRASRHIDG